MLIALGILVVILGIAVPMVGSAIDRRRVRSVAEEIVGAMLMARAHAQAEGVTVEMIVVEGGRSDSATRLLAREIDLHAPPFDGEAGPPPLARVWADTRLDPRWSLRAATADDDDEERPASAPRVARDREPMAGVLSEPIRERVVVFSADGSAIIATRLRLTDAAGRSIDILVSPFTGLPRIDAGSERRQEPIAADQLAGDERFGIGASP